jgi:hypothetical protein
MVMKRSLGIKYECPIYIYKPSKNVVDVGDVNPRNAYFRELYIDSFLLASPENDKIWIEKNVCMVCELP